jgi:hypothetical protein
LWDFEANGENEINVKADQVVKVLQDFGFEELDNEWWKIEADDKVGYIPANYLEVIQDDAPTFEVLSTRLFLFNFSFFFALFTFPQKIPQFPPILKFIPQLSNSSNFFY